MKHLPNEQLDVTQLPDGRASVKFALGVTMSGGSPEGDNYSLSDPVLLIDTVTPSKRKCEASNWLLQQFRNSMSNESAALMFLELFVSNLRSITWSLQATFSKSEGFKEWYKIKQNEMRPDSRLTWLVKTRNDAVKRGLITPCFAPTTNVKYHRDGRVSQEPGIPKITVRELKTDDLLEALEFANNYIRELVDEAHEQFEIITSGHGINFGIQFLRETESGDWEPFDP